MFSSVQSLGILWNQGAKDCENSCITESLYLRVIIVDGFVVVVTRVADAKDHNIAGVLIWLSGVDVVVVG